jgi:hypothetical protein
LELKPNAQLPQVFGGGGQPKHGGVRFCCSAGSYVCTAK